MGFFSKIFKGVKKVFKKIGKAVKSVFKKVGKFMGKIGIVGQIALGFIMPYALPALGAALGGLSTGLTTFGAKAGGFLGTIAKGAGQFINTAIKVGSQVGKAFTSITEAVKTTIGQVVGTTINQIPGAGDFLKGLTGGRLDITQMKDFGTAFQKVGEAWTNAGDTLTGFFDKKLYDSSLNQFSLDKMAAQRAELTGQIQETLGADTVTQGLDPSKISTPYDEFVPVAPSDSLLAPSTTSQSFGVLQTPEVMQGVDFNRSFDAMVQSPELNITNAEAQMNASKFLEGPMPEVSTGTKAFELGKKAAGELAAAGVKPTVGGIAQSLMAPAQEEMEYTVQYGPSINLPPVMAPDFAQPQGGLFYGTQPTFDSGPGLVDMLMNQDWNSIYKYGFYGRPAAIAGMANYVADEGLIQ